MLIEKSRWDYIKIMMLDTYMEGHKGFIAGGCFKNIFMGEKIKDIDMFFHNVADMVEAERHYESNEDYVFYYETEKVKAYKNTKHGTVVELVKTVYGTPKDIISNFDFTITKFAYYKKYENNPETGDIETTYSVLVHENFFEHLLLKRTVIDDKIPFPANSFERMIKYTKYGFYPCRETKMKLLQEIHKMPSIPDISMGLYDGLD